MPVVSPSRFTTSSSSTLTNSLSSGSYRSTLASSTSLEKPYFRTSSGTYVSSTLRSSYGDRGSDFRSRYLDTDTKRKTSLISEYSRTSRAPSAGDSDSGISSRYISRSERSESRSRDLSAPRSENSKTSTSDPLPRNSSTSIARRNVSNSAILATSAADLYNKYSPSNYIPYTQRLSASTAQNNSYGEISRSKSISNDIGRPPASDFRSSRKARNSTASSTITEHQRVDFTSRPARSSSSSGRKEASPGPGSHRKHSTSNGARDSNGNEIPPSVAEIRKRFDSKMTVTKLPANDTRFSAKASMENYMTQLKCCQNGTTSYTKVLPKDEKPVPVHLPNLEKVTNGIGHRWELGSSSSKSNSNSDLSLSKTTSEPVLLAKPTIDRMGDMTTSLTARLPSERIALASVKSQLGPNNPIGKILEKSTVIQVENGDRSYSPERKYSNKNITSIKVSTPSKTKESLKSDIEKQTQKSTPKHTSNFASYIQISQPIASGTSLPSKITKSTEINSLINGDIGHDSKPLESQKLMYIDSEADDRLILENDMDSPSANYPGFENKMFEHENYLMKRGKDEVDFVKSKTPQAVEEYAKPMDTSTESTTSDLTEDSSPDTPLARRKELDNAPPEEARMELAGGKSGPSGVRRSSERAELLVEARGASQSSGLNGLRNIGNTCFMNSVVQCLSNTRPLLEYVTEDRHLPEINTTLSCMKGALIKAFATVIKELWREGERDSVVNTTALKAQVQRFAPRFMGYSQQDAQEFLRYLLEGLHEDVNRVTSRPKPIHTEIDDNLSDAAKATEAWSRYLRMEESRVGDIFMGQLKSTLRCTHCHHDSVTFDPFWDLSLPIPSRTGNLKLQQCLAHFTREEELDGDEKPTCSKCGVRRKCLKWFTVQKFPRVLVIHLKRFSPTERFRGKLNVVVEFPLTGLEMAPYAATRGQEATYSLYAVSNHSGTTYSGHYTAYCKHPYTGDWHEYNDSRVSTISPRNVVSSEAYVLFYELQPSGAACHL